MYAAKISLSGGPTLTLGHFIKPFLDYTQITVIGGGTLRQGLAMAQDPTQKDRLHYPCLVCVSRFKRPVRIE